jgi:hypothetical protein
MCAPSAMRSMATVARFLSASWRGFAKMHFSEIPVDEFRGYLPTGASVHWAGAALFRSGGDAIIDLWVLGDLESLDAMLEKNRNMQPNVSDSQ